MSGEAVVRTLVVSCPDWPVVAAGAPPGEPSAVRPRQPGGGHLARRPGRRGGGGPTPPGGPGALSGARRAGARPRPRRPGLRGGRLRPGGFHPPHRAVPPRPRRLPHPGPVAVLRRRRLARRRGGHRGREGRGRPGLARRGRGRRGRRGLRRPPGGRPPRPSDVVEPGGSPAHLAPLPVSVLGRPELADVLVRLGLRTLGAFAALDPADVVARFGADGRVAHRLARGLDERPPATAPPPRHLEVAAALDPPAERVDVAAFVAKGLADELHDRLDRRGPGVHPGAASSPRPSTPSAASGCGATRAP